MDDYDRGLRAGLLIGEGRFLNSGPSGRPRLRVSVKLHTRSERFLRETRDAVRLGHVYGPCYHAHRQYVLWHITRLEELADLCRMLDVDNFAARCDWVGWRYGRMRDALRYRIAW